MHCRSVVCAQYDARVGITNSPSTCAGFLITIFRFRGPRIEFSCTRHGFISLFFSNPIRLRCVILYAEIVLLSFCSTTTSARQVMDVMATLGGGGAPRKNSSIYTKKSKVNYVMVMALVKMKS